MPYKTDKLSIESPFLDKRCKLLPCQKERIVYLRETENLSQRKLAEIFKVSRRTIQFIIDPSKHYENLKRREERGGTKIYYNKEKNNIAQKEHRIRKYNLLKDK